LDSQTACDVVGGRYMAWKIGKKVHPLWKVSINLTNEHLSQFS